MSRIWCDNCMSYHNFRYDCYNNKNKDIKVMQNYNLCFIFNENYSEVILILKDRPKYQAGLYNGVGGKTEPDESSYEACQREVFEEVGIKIDRPVYLSTLSDNKHYSVVVYNTYISKKEKPINNKTSEIAKWFSVNKLPKNLVEDVGRFINDSIFDYNETQKA